MSNKDYEDARRKLLIEIEDAYTLNAISGAGVQCGPAGTGNDCVCHVGTECPEGEVPCGSGTDTCEEIMPDWICCCEGMVAPDGC